MKVSAPASRAPELRGIEVRGRGTSAPATSLHDERGLSETGRLVGIAPEAKTQAIG